MGVTTAGVRVPLGPNEVKTGLAVFDTLPTSGLAFTFLTIGAIELGFAQIKDELEEYCATTYPDGYPCPHGPREARQQPLHHQRSSWRPCSLQLSLLILRRSVFNFLISMSEICFSDAASYVNFFELCDKV